MVYTRKTKGRSTSSRMSGCGSPPVDSITAQNTSRSFSGDNRPALDESANHHSPDFRQFGVASQNSATNENVLIQMSSRFVSLTTAIEASQSQMSSLIQLIAANQTQAQASGATQASGIPSSSHSSQSSSSGTSNPTNPSRTLRRIMSNTQSIAEFRTPANTFPGGSTRRSNRQTSAPNLMNQANQRTRDYVEQYGPDIKTSCEVAPQRIMPINQVIPPKFNGDKSKARSWLKEYTHAMTVNGYDQAQMFAHVSVYLTDSAWNWWVFETRVNPDLDWYSFRHRFITCFLGEDTLAALAKRIDSVRQKSDESPFEYLTRATELCLEFEPNMPDKDIINRVAPGFLHESYNHLAMQKKKQEWTLPWLSEKVLDLRSPQSKKDIRESKSTTAASATRAPKSVRVKDLSDWTCFNCSRKGHLIADCDQPQNEANIEANKKAYSSKRKATGDVAESTPAREVNNL